ncbi:MAG: hypothetical protein ACOY5B_11410 [Spirochaetota bacterium]
MLTLMSPLATFPRILLLAAAILSAGRGELWAADKQKQENSDLARVGIARFANADQDPDYEWVETSLPDAISNSMRAKFEFVSQDSTLVDSAFRAHYQQSDRIAVPIAAKIAAASQTDILIIGKFRVDRENSEIVMQAVIYNADGGRFIGQVEERSEVNNRIFKQIDTMASSIVSVIYQYALQANKAAAKNNLRMLVLVPSFTTKEERAQAEAELLVLKDELARQSPGNYITLFEFFEQYKVADYEQERALQLAANKDRSRIKIWLENYGVTDAYLVFVRDNKVNITAVSATKTAQVSYAVGATTEEKQQALQKAQAEVGTKTALVKEEGLFPGVLNLHVGVGAAKGILQSGSRIGVMSGPVVHASVKLWRFLQPQLRFEGYYAFQQGELAGILGASALGGLGYTTGTSRWSITPFAAGGIFTARVKTDFDQIYVLLPSVSAGFLFAWNVRPGWGLSFSASSQYVHDPIAPALFFTGTLASVVRF